jgi:hypothetical protein
MYSDWARYEYGQAIDDLNSFRGFFRQQLYSPTALSNLPRTREDTPKNFASRRGDVKIYMAVNMSLLINHCPISY